MRQGNKKRSEAAGDGQASDRHRSIEDTFPEGLRETIAAAGARPLSPTPATPFSKASPQENREIPPLKYAYVYRLKRDFPQLEIVINGGIVSNEQIQLHLPHVDA